VASLLWGFDLSASIRDCTAAYASSACFAHASHRAAIWLHVAFSLPRLEFAMRPHSAAWRRNSSDRFIAYLVEAAHTLSDKFKGSFTVPAFVNEDMLRRSNEALGRIRYDNDGNRDVVDGVGCRCGSYRSGQG
jgi:hypothetical protein